MANVQKYAASAIGHLAAHYERHRDAAGEYVKFGNQNIDQERTHLNYNLAPDRPDGQVSFIRQRCGEVRCMKRDDVKILCSWVVTAPRDLPQESENDFFRATYDFLENRYGRENVVSAYVHMDEVTPHMHFAFVPVVIDQKRGDLKVSAKEVLTRTDLRTFHMDLSEYVRNQLGFEVSILNDATKDGNREVAELKKASAHREVLEAQEKAAAAQHALEEKLVVLDAIQRKLAAFRGRELSIQEIQSIHPQTGITGALRGITVDDVENLKATAIRGLQARDAFAKLSEEYKRVKEMVPTVQEQLEQAEELRRLRDAEVKLRELEKVFQRLPEHIQKQLLPPVEHKSYDRQHRER